VGEFDQPVGNVAGGECFARTRSHLNQRAGAVVGQWLFEICDCSDLLGPEFRRVQWRHVKQAGAKLIGAELGETNRFLGPVEVENFFAAGVGIENAGELRNGARRFVGKRQRHRPTRQTLRESCFRTLRRSTLSGRTQKNVKPEKITWRCKTK
jgi:hypothetical protein